MGIYFSNIRSILEVKRKINGQEEDLDQEENNNEESENDQEDNNTEDNQDTGEENNEDDEHADPGEASDYSMDVDDNDQETDDTQDNTDSTESGNDTGEENNEDDEHTDPGDSNDYSMDVDDSEDDGESGDDESSEDNTNDSESNDISNGDEGGDTELKSLEDDIFKDVPPEQMNIKIMELKKQYLEVYATITDVLTRCNKIPKTTQNMKVVEFIINKLVEFKELVNFYLSNTFDTKTYVENMVNYQQYLATLNTINKLLKEINTKKENNS